MLGYILLYTGLNITAIHVLITSRVTRQSFTVHPSTSRLTVHLVEDWCDGFGSVHGLGLHRHVGLFRGRPWPAPTLFAARTRIPHGGASTRDKRGTQGRLLPSLFTLTPGKWLISL